MKVLIISPGLPSEQYPLNGVFAFDQAKALASHGIDVTFFSIDLRSLRNRRKFVFSSSLREGVQCYTYSIPLGPVGYDLLNWVGCRASSMLFKKVYKKQPQPDVIHTHFSASVGAFLSQKFGIPLVITEHSSTMNRTDLPQEVLDRAKNSYLQAKKVITVSSLLANNLYNKVGIQCKVIHNIIDTAVFSAYERKRHDSSFVFVTTALLSERKRIHKLIPVIKELPDKVKLIVVGDGPERVRLEQLIDECHLRERIEMKGLLSREETAKVYSTADCFVLPSALETFGVVYVEAMAAGLPVIATRCGGPEDFVAENNGLLIDVDNQTQLCEAMSYMVENAGFYSPNVIKEYVQSRFSPEVIAKEIINVYTEIVKK